MIFVTGGTGFIGKPLVERLARCHKIRCLVRSASRSKIAPNPAVEIVERDLLSSAIPKESLDGVETVIHLAALLRSAKASDIYRVNVTGTRLLVDACKKNGVRRFIFLSTENALREDLRDAYPESKRQAERIVKELENFLILRPCFVYGPGDTHGLGKLADLARQWPFAPLFGGLKSKIQPIHIQDMVECLTRAVFSEISGEYLLAGPESISINDFIKKTLKARRLDKPPVPLPYPFYFLAAKFCDIFLPEIGWGSPQLMNIYRSRTYSIEKTVKDFGYAPRGINEGLKLENP
ncbi:MAG: NAD-dependent epimerase/dehydratase family protein [Candidatus Omnitrophica bacterium]|nr:NAD-dependent epimerase/dehydratase family protein [Candidatus Omnitrophota bacterium]